MRPAAVVLALLPAPALAQGPFIEIGFSAVADDFFTGEPVARYEARVVFDAAAAPTASTATTVVFEAVSAEYAFASESTLTFDDPDVDPPEPPPIPAALVYSVAADRWRVVVDAGFGSYNLSVEAPRAGFSAGMASLPDDPGSYKFDGSDNDTVQSSAPDGNVVWTPATGFIDGVISYWIREVPNPDPPAPCVADCNGDSTLNVDDIDCFVAAFLGGCP